MNDLDRPTARVVELIDAHIAEPPVGTRILALTKGNVLVPAIWMSNSLEYFDAWMIYPKVPISVKERLYEKEKRSAAAANAATYKGAS